MKKLITIMMVLMLTGFMFAQPRMGQNQLSMNQNRPMTTQNILDLTDSQMSQLQELRTEYQKDMIPLRADVRVKRIEVKELIANGKSKKSIDAKENLILKTQSKMADLRINHQIAVRKIVGEENYKKMGTMHQYHGRKSNGRKGFRGRR